MWDMFAISSFMLLEDYKQKSKPDSTLCFVIYYCLREAPVIKESQNGSWDTQPSAVVFNADGMFDDSLSVHISLLIFCNFLSCLHLCNFLF